MKAIAQRTARNAFTHRIDIRQHQLTADEPSRARRRRRRPQPAGAAGRSAGVVHRCHHGDVRQAQGVGRRPGGGPVRVLARRPRLPHELQADRAGCPATAPRSRSTNCASSRPSARSTGRSTARSASTSGSSWSSPRPPPERAPQSTTSTPAARSSSTARSPSPGWTSTARVAPRWTVTSRPAPARIERRRLHAVVEREPGDVDGVGLMLAQQPLELGALEPRVALPVARLTFVEDRVDETSIDPVMQLRPRRTGHAVHRPRPALVGERAVVGRMPVTRGHDERRLRRPAG